MSELGSSVIYEPEMLGALQEIFDQAWQEMNAVSGHDTGEDASRRRNDLAQMIVLCTQKRFTARRNPGRSTG